VELQVPHIPQQDLLGFTGGTRTGTAPRVDLMGFNRISWVFNGI